MLNVTLAGCLSIYTSLAMVRKESLMSTFCQSRMKVNGSSANGLLLLPYHEKLVAQFVERSPTAWLKKSRE